MTENPDPNNENVAGFFTSMKNVLDGSEHREYRSNWCAQLDIYYPVIFLYVCFTSKNQNERTSK